MGNVIVKYTKSEDCSPVYINGAMGGLGTQNDIVINFFFEKRDIPDIMIHEVTEEGMLGNIVNIDPPNSEITIIRQLQTGIVTDRKSAVTIYKWLGNILKSIGEIPEE